MLSEEIRDALQGGNQNEIWSAYKFAWDAGSSPAMDGAVLVGLLRDYSRQSEVLQLMESDRSARVTIEDAARTPEGIDAIFNDPHGLSNQGVWCVLFRARGVDDSLQIWLAERFRGHAGQRGQLASTVTDALCRFVDGWEAQRLITAVWRHHSLIQQEQVSILRALGGHGVLTRETFTQLRSHAPYQVGHPETPQLMRTRVDALFHLASIEANIKDAGLSSHEMSQLGHAWSPHLATAALALHGGHPFFHELFEEFLAIPASHWPNGVPRFGDDHVLTFPLLRLLHLRLLLEAPSLASAFSSPEDALIPDVMLWVLGRDAVTYSPELRLNRGAERRWRARWAESTAEALSVMLLEDALELDLTTLARIPEQRNEKTPDFQVQARGRRPVVFESKGASSWPKHLSQRKEALGQLGKTKGNMRSREHGWASSGRSFACCLFAATQGEERSSLFHVDDPPFGFDHLFLQGWEIDARVRHYAAVAESARMYRFADSVLQRRPERGMEEETSVFTLGDEESSGRRFRGTKIPLGPQALALRHPQAEDYETASIFIGMDDDLFMHLAHGHVPSSDELAEGQSTLLSRVGLVPGWRGGPSRGVYSLLADGSFLAVVVE